MPSLVSAGVSVPVTDRSFYIPAVASTVPLIFGATRANKFQPDGISIADGTNEHSLIRTITSIGQSVELYGIPYFHSDNSGPGNTEVQYHGDARNEYGLFALNQFLGVGSKAFFVRANIDLTDEAITFISAGIPQVIDPIEGIRVGEGTVSNIVVPSQFEQPETWTLVAIGPQIGETVMSFTVTGSVSGMVGIARAGTTFTNSGAIEFLIEEAALPADQFSPGDYFEFTSIYVPSTFTGAGNGQVIDLVAGSGAIDDEQFTITFTSPTTFTVTGIDPVTSAITTPTIAGVVGTAFSDPADHINFTITAGTTAFAIGDEFTIDFTKVQVFNPLGVTDANKRQAIVTALQAEINSNQDIRSEAFEYNLILCPGYPEVVDELLALSDTLGNEAFVVADTPVNKTPEQTANWANTNKRFNHTDVAYYYPWGLASNLDGKDVVVAPSGIALRTYAYSDNQSYVWFAPAGVRRGVVTGVASVGYVTGTLGQATKYIEVNLNQGQRDNLYEFYKNINPIVYFPGRGLLIWGQKTSAGAASARDRVNVERMLCYIRRQLRKGAFPFVFEINDQITRDDLKAMIDGFLADIMSLRGLYDYVTVCDASNNTPVRIDRNELWADIGLKPSRVAEFLYLPITLYTTGASMGKN
jgi:phage tail sheath protein FI